jgi:hypothetical protein
VVTITPDRAEAILAHNHTNRKVRWSVVDRYANDMVAGEWRPGVGSIVLDQNGHLVDGQHRLHACVKAGVPIEVVVVTGAEETAQLAMDTGLRRGLADVLSFRGETQTSALAAAVNRGWQWANGKLLSNVRPTHAEALDWLDRNPTIRDAVIKSGRVRRTLDVAQSPLTVVAHQTWLIDGNESDAFLERLATGEDLEAGSAILALRNWAINFSTRPPKPGPIVYMAVMVKAWNAWATGRPLQTLVWRRGGTNKEDFPELKDLDGTTWHIRDEVEQ